MNEMKVKMPEYKCKKIVWALKIKALNPYETCKNCESDGSYMITPDEEGYAPFKVSEEFMRKHEPKVGGYYVIYRDDYKSYSPAKAFEDGYENNIIDVSKTFKNTTASHAKDNVNDIQFWGDGDTWKLISKAWSEKEGWMKSTKAMQIRDNGCLVQVTTQQGDNVSEAVTFVPGTIIVEEFDDKGTVVGRHLEVFVYQGDPQ